MLILIGTNQDLKLIFDTDFEYRLKKLKIETKNEIGKNIYRHPKSISKSEK